MTLKLRFQIPNFGLVALLAILLAAPIETIAADQSAASAQKQRDLIQLLQSNAPKADKALACKQLAVYGTKDAVPALEGLLADEQLASWARIALEVIPDAAVDDALHNALSRLNGKLLIGAINSIGVRRDVKAVGLLAGKLKDSDVSIASAAAEALGNIADEQAGRTLLEILPTASEALCPSIAEGCIVCGGHYLAEGKLAAAVQLFDTVRQAKVPKQRKLEAIRGAILARKADGIPLLLEQLRSSDKACFEIGVSTARELPGSEPTAALVAELNQAKPDRQVSLVLAIADRNDSTALPAVLQVAKNGSKPARATAVGLLDRWQDPVCVPVLLNAAADDDADLVRAAKAVLSRLEGKAIDAAIKTSLSQATGKTLQATIDMVGRRRIEDALPTVVKHAESGDAGIRRAALDTLGAIGGISQGTDLARLLEKTGDNDKRSEIVKPLVKIAGRSGAKFVPEVLPLAQSNDSGLRRSALPVLAAIGGADALKAMQAAVSDKDETVQDEAVRLLSTWPNNWPDDAGVAEPLFALAKSGRKESHQVQGIRGYLLYLQEHKELKNDDKLAKIKELLPLIKRSEEKHQVITVLGTLPAEGALEPLMSLAQDPALAEEASLSIVNVAKDGPVELRKKALQIAAAQAKNAETKRKAEESLNSLK